MKKFIQELYLNFKDKSYIPGTHRIHQEFLLDNILPYIEGDILEIGAHLGLTTQILCKIAAKNNKNVYVIDPWDGRQQGNQSVFENFKRNTEKYKNLFFYRGGSETKEAINFVNNKKFAYIFFDGLHTYKAVKRDMFNFIPYTVDESIICVDDIRGKFNWVSDILKAVNEINKETLFNHFLSPNNFRETYLYKKI